MPNPRGLPVSSTATVVTATVATVATADLLYHHLRPLHRRSERPELHSLAQLSEFLPQQPTLHHHADRARHR
jgi:hypothetical protein